MKIHLEWASDGASHRDTRVLPGASVQNLVQARLIDSGSLQDATAVEDGARVLGLEPDARLRRVVYDDALARFRSRGGELRVGLHFPSRALGDNPSGAHVVARCVRRVEGGWLMDFNHPLAARAPRLSAQPSAVAGPAADPDRMRSLVLDTGAGLQAMANDSPLHCDTTDYARQDGEADAGFYESPRLVQHIDECARRIIGNFYASEIPQHARVLDVMSSWVSHLPDTLVTGDVIGLGMNAVELANNARLSAYHVQDLNRNGVLPFADNEFDTVICTVSIEYLVCPVDVLRDIARVLAPGGQVLISFSNRCFPTKAVRLWGRVHEFERLALVCTWLQQTGCFTDLRTRSVRGYPRPADDPYAEQSPYADPVYAVAATVA